MSVTSEHKSTKALALMNRSSTTADLNHSRGQNDESGRLGVGGPRISHFEQRRGWFELFGGSRGFDDGPILLQVFSVEKRVVQSLAVLTNRS